MKCEFRVLVVSKFFICFGVDFFFFCVVVSFLVFYGLAFRFGSGIEKY